MKKQQNSGFTLVEVIVATVISSILFAGLIFAYRSLWSVNSLSLKKDQGVNLATTLIEELSTKRFSTLNEEELGINIPNSFDLSNSTTDIINNADGSKKIIITNIAGKSFDYNAIIDVKPSDYIEENKLQFPDVRYLDDTHNCVLAYNSEANKFKMTDDIYDKGLENEYLRDFEHYYDRMAFQSFLNKHLSYVNSIYVDEYSRILTYNSLHPDNELPLPKIDDYTSILNEDNFIGYFKDIVSRSTYIEIYNNRDFINVTAELVYTLDDNKAQDLVDLINSSTILNIDNLTGSYGNEESIYLLRDSTYYDMKSIIVEYEPSICFEDNFYINSSTSNLLYGDKEFDLYFYVSEKYTDFNKTQKYKHAVLNEFNLVQDLPAKLVNVWTNSPEIRDTLITCGTLQSVNLATTKKADATARMYSVEIAIEDLSGTNVYSTIESNVLKY